MRIHHSPPINKKKKKFMSSRCDSCGVPLEPHEMFRTVELEDGTKKEIIDNMCNSCIHQYVYAADELPTKDYQHQRVTDLLWDDVGNAGLGSGRYDIDY